MSPTPIQENTLTTLKTLSLYSVWFVQLLSAFSPCIHLDFLDNTMLRLTQKLRQTTTVTTATLLSCRLNPLLPPPPRFYGATFSSDVDPVALQMINYALGLARSQKSGESYAQGLLVLEQCLSSNVCEGHQSASSQNTRGVVLLAMSNLLSERGDFGEAMEKLDRIHELGSSSLGVRTWAFVCVTVAALEGLVGLNLEIGQDATSSKFADKCFQLLETSPEGSESEGLDYRAKAVKGLVELLLGNTETAESCFGEAQEGTSCTGHPPFSHGELLHALGNLASAKELYQKAIQGTPETVVGFSDPYGLATGNMVPVEAVLGATCALGQLEAHSGNFKDAEEILTKALTRAEDHFGANHPKVGIVLTCIALMFRHKARLEHSSSILIQEGLYRKAIDLLKAPSLDTEEVNVKGRDIMALARGGYAEILSVQQNRKSEGERMRKWAEATWKNRRLSLAEALEISEPSSRVAVVDTRISRAL